MTMPDERIRALRFAKELLESLLSSEEWPELPNELRRQAQVTLRHYPTANDLRLLHVALPQFYGPLTDPMADGCRQNQPEEHETAQQAPRKATT
jgi:hypothetical protein